MKARRGDRVKSLKEFRESNKAAVPAGTWGTAVPAGTWGTVRYVKGIDVDVEFDSGTIRTVAAPFLYVFSAIELLGELVL